MNVRVRKHLRRRSPVEHHDIPSIEHRLSRKGRVTLDSGQEAIVTRGFPIEHPDIQTALPWIELREHVNSTVDRLLGWNIVPPTTLRITSDGLRVVSAQEFIPEAKTLDDIKADIRRDLRREGTRGELLERIDRRRLMQIALLDMVMGQTDRHDYNVVVDAKGRPWAIDNEASLERPWTKPDDFGTGGATGTIFRGEPIPSNLRSDLRNLSRGDFYAALAGIEKENIDAAWKRKQALVRAEVFP